MYYIINNKVKDLNLNDLEYLGEGCESHVYKYGDRALKIYKSDCTKKRITDIECNYMKEIKTQRILLPIGVISNLDGDTLGITTSYIDGEKDKEELLEVPTFKLIREMKLLTRDAEDLGSRHISIDDITVDNTIFNGSLYVVDPGSFRVDYTSIRQNLSTAIIENMNMYMISDYFIYGLLKEITKDKYGEEVAKELTEHLAKDFAYSSANTSEKYFEKKLQNYDNYDHFVKSYIKKR